MLAYVYHIVEVEDMETPKVQINSGSIFLKPKIARMPPFQLAVDVSAAGEL